MFHLGWPINGVRWEALPPLHQSSYHWFFMLRAMVRIENTLFLFLLYLYSTYYIYLYFLFLLYIYSSQIIYSYYKACLLLSKCDVRNISPEIKMSANNRVNNYLLLDAPKMVPGKGGSRWRGNAHIFASCLQILHRSYNASIIQCLIVCWCN